MTLGSKELCISAAQAAENAYAPYSNFQVGAAVLTSTGEVLTGCNIENASYGLTICAERVALGNAIAQGHREFTSIAVSSKNAVSPCGACRQFIREFGADIKIHLADENGELQITCSIEELLPKSFNPNSLI